MVQQLKIWKNIYTYTSIIVPIDHCRSLPIQTYIHNFICSIIIEIHIFYLLRLCLIFYVIRGKKVSHTPIVRKSLMCCCRFKSFAPFEHEFFNTGIHASTNTSPDKHVRNIPNRWTSYFVHRFKPESRVEPNQLFQNNK